MGEKCFTFTGLLNDEPKKEEQVITYVKVPRHEYARLIAAKAKLDIIERLLMESDKYIYLREVPKLLFSSSVSEEDAE